IVQKSGTSSLIDLISILPFWFGLGSEWFLFRILRLLRILKLARIPGLSIALKGIVFAIKRRKFELYISIGLATLMMLGASTVLYIVEADIQPEAFGSIPRSLWWGMATLTTVGYGDVYPVTILGKLFFGVFAFAGIGLVAMPTGILAAALSDSFQNAGKTLNDDN
ncbi:MAG: potassium channel family protein, partial [Emcibacter sp.]|nr:potassium channel family protein [Emcibacter sp.]